MHLEHDIDGGAGARAWLGLIVLQADETIENEFRRLLDMDGVALHVTRVASGVEVGEDSLAGLAEGIAGAARLLPVEVSPDVLGFACTSGATVIGPAQVARLIHEARAADAPGSFARSAVTDPLTAVMAACDALGVHRLGFVTPYVPAVSAAMRAALERAGLEVSAFGSFEVAREHRVARISPASVCDAIVRVGSAAGCDAVFASCTNLRTLEVLEEAERRLGLPVISSNQALAWHMLRLAGVMQPRAGAGRLFLR